MCHLWNIVMCDYQEKCDYRTDKHPDGQTPDKVIPMCRYASKARQLELSEDNDAHRVATITKKQPRLKFFKSMSNFKVKVRRSLIMVPCEKSCHKEYTSAIWKPYCIQGKFRPCFIFALWLKGEFITGPSLLCIKDYVTKLDSGRN